MAKRYKCDFWKPRSDGKGAAAIFEFNPDSKTFWFQMLPQGGENGKKFDTKKKISAKIGRADISQFLLVLRGKAEGFGNKNDKGFWDGLIHKIQGSEDSTIINLSKYFDANKADKGYNLGLSAKRGGVATRLSVGLTNAEAEGLEVFFTTYLPALFEDDGTGGAERPPEDNGEAVNI